MENLGEFMNDHPSRKMSCETLLERIYERLEWTVVFKTLKDVDRVINIFSTPTHFESLGGDPPHISR
jgi:hypothetical protein